jgi:hypothetical protein
MLEDQKADAQEALDELFTEDLIPFRLVAHTLESVGSEEYIVRFRDSRLPSVDISWLEGKCFKDVFRAAVLDRVQRLSGPVRARKTHA